MSRNASRKGSPHDALSQSKSLEVGMSVSRGLHPAIPEEGIYGELRRYLGEVLRRLARQRESEVEEGHLLVDHVHMMLSIPPKYSVAQVIGYIKGKSAIHIAREFAGRSRSFVGQHFGARGYFVSTLGRDERAIRAYIRAQELEDRRHEQLRLDERSHPEGGPSGRVAATSGRFERLTTKSPRLCRGIFTGVRCGGFSSLDTY